MKTSWCLPQASDSRQACGSPKQIVQWWTRPRSVGNRSWTKWTCSLAAMQRENTIDGWWTSQPVCILSRIFWTKPLNKQSSKSRGWAKATAYTAVSKPFILFASNENHLWGPLQAASLYQINSSHVIHCNTIVTMCYYTVPSFISISGIGPQPTTARHWQRDATEHLRIELQWSAGWSLGDLGSSLAQLLAAARLVNWDAVQTCSKSNHETPLQNVDLSAANFAKDLWIAMLHQPFQIGAEVSLQILQISAKVLLLFVN